MDQNDVLYEAKGSGDDSTAWHFNEDTTLASFRNTLTFDSYLNPETEASVVTHHMIWDFYIPENTADVTGFDELGVIHLAEYYTSQSTVEPQNINHHYFAYSDTLKKVCEDYERYAGMFWRMAQMMVPRFPHHNVDSQITILDPLDDLPADCFYTGLYAEVFLNDDETLPIRVALDPPQSGRKLHPHCELHYDARGILGGFSSHTIRGDKEWCLKISICRGEWYVAEVSSITKSCKGASDRQVLYSGDYDKYMNTLRDRGIVPSNRPRQLYRSGQNNSSQTNTSSYMWSEVTSPFHINWLKRDREVGHKTPDSSLNVGRIPIAKDELSRIAVDCEVSSDTFGKGVITSMDESYVMVRFPDKERRFQWPGAFENGFLSLA